MLLSHGILESQIHYIGIEIENHKQHLLSVGTDFKESWMIKAL